MHKVLCTLGWALLMVSALVLPAAAQPTVVVDGRTLTFDVPPVIEGGRNLVPLRAIFEALGANVHWEGATQTVTASRFGTVIQLQIGAKTAYVSGNPVTLDVPGRILAGRTLVPLRFVGEGLGASVVYDGTTKTIKITSVTSKSESPSASRDAMDRIEKAIEDALNAAVKPSGTGVRRDGR